MAHGYKIFFCSTSEDKPPVPPAPPPAPPPPPLMQSKSLVPKIGEICGPGIDLQSHHGIESKDMLRQMQSRLRSRLKRQGGGSEARSKGPPVGSKMKDFKV